MTGASHSEGILLWVDDDLEVAELTAGDQGPDLWDRTFGSAESRVFRLLGLHLDVARSVEGALEAIQAYREAEGPNTFVTAVVDMCIPYWDDFSDDPLLVHGLHVARTLKDAGIPFRILSSRVDAIDELPAHGLEATPYYRKQVEGGRPMMPEELSRAILSDFKEQIDWINIANIYSDISRFCCMKIEDVGHQDIINPHYYFPFFGIYQDFLERWEGRPLPCDGRLNIVLRASLDHSDTYVGQCVLLALSQCHFAGFLNHAEPVQIYSHDPCGRDLLRAKQAEQETLVVSIIRIDPRAETPEHLKRVIEEQRGKATVYVIPNDERAEPFLDLLPRDRWSIHDDLPGTHRSGSTSRQALIRKGAVFVFQSSRLRRARDAVSAGRLYREHPEVAMDPVHWYAFLERENSLNEIGDHTQILEALVEAMARLEDLPDTSKARVRDGRPLPPEELLPVGGAVPEVPGRERAQVVAGALDAWLRSSWRFPHGAAIDDAGGASEDNGIHREWEDFALKVLDRLVRDYRAMVPDDPGGAGTPLHQVVAFIEHPAIAALIRGETPETPAWEGIEGLRWPYQTYPMPLALNRKLKAAGCHLWVQSDTFDVATVLPDSGRAYRALDHLVAEQQARLDWLHERVPHLPAGWRQSLGHLTDVVRRRRVAEAWNEAPGDVWNALMSLQRNALRLSVIVHLLLAGRPVDRKPEKKKGHDAGILQQVTAAGGSGELVGKVRGHRRALRGSVLWPRFQDGHVWTETADRIAHFARMGEGLAGHLGAETADERLCTMSRCLAHMIHTVGKADAGDDGLDGRERATAFRHLMGMLDAALDDEAWFPGTDTETGAALFLDPRSDAAERFPAGTMPSLFGTRADFLWQGLDAAHDLRRAMMGQRYYDGYAFLAGMVDLRNAGRDQHRPAFRVPVVEAILQILVWSAEGLVAQLKLALHAAGRSDLADNLPLSRLVLALPEGFPAATPDQVGRVLRVRDETDGYAVFVPGLAGGRGSRALAVDEMGTARRLADSRAAAE